MMLLRIDPALTADVLYVLQAMGHGDDVVICDTNSLASAIGRQTVHGRELHMDNVTAARAVRAVLSVMPMDSFVEHPVERMEVVGSPGEIPAVQQEVQAEVDVAARPGAGRENWTMASIERFAFYERAKQANAVIATDERRFYGCFILKKGVIPPE